MASLTRLPDVNRRILKKDINKENVACTKQATNKNPVLKKSESTTSILGSRRQVFGDINDNNRNKLKKNLVLAPASKALVLKQPVAEIKKKEIVTVKPFAATNKATLIEESKSYSTQILEEIEENEGTDPQFVPEYINDIFSYMRDMELSFPIRESFLKDHKTTARMRSVLINWLVEVHLNFKMLPETLHLCVAIVDRYLQEDKSVGKHNLQLVGVTALLIASKYEEIHIENISDFVYVCDDTFSQKQILNMELSILKTLNFSLGRPLSLHFLRRYSKVGKVLSSHHSLAKYLLELALIEYDLSHVRPSMIAAAATALSLAILNNRVVNVSSVWTKTLRHYSTYKYSELEPVMQKLAYVLANVTTSKAQAIKKKYALPVNSKISLRPELNNSVVTTLINKSL